MKKITATIERSSDGSYSVYHKTDGMDFLITGAGTSATEAKEEFLQNYQEMKDDYLERSAPWEDIEWEWQYDVSSFLQYYAYAFTLAGLSRITGVSQGVLSHYVNGTSKPSQKQKERIQQRLHDFASTLADVKFV